MAGIGNSVNLSMAGNGNSVMLNLAGNGNSVRLTLVGNGIIVMLTMAGNGNNVIDNLHRDSDHAVILSNAFLIDTVQQQEKLHIDFTRFIC